MDEDKEKKKKKDPFGDFGFGEYGDMDRAMNNMMKEFEKMFNTSSMGEIMGGMMKDLEKMFSDPDKFMEMGKPKMYGFSLKVGPDGKPVFQRFGDVQTPKKVIPQAREPFSDIIDKGNEIRVIIELPGVEEKNIKTNATKAKLTIKVERGSNKFFKEIDLPGNVDPKNIKSSYKNGILEVILRKKG